MSNRLFITIIIVFMGFSLSFGQQFPVYTQYTMNKFVYNPAVAGSDGYTSVNLIAREQWVGFKGTPKTHALSIDSRILGNSYIFKKLSIRKDEPRKTRSGNTGWGAYVFSDLNGPIDRTGINGTYSYHINMGNSQLSFGLGIMFFQLRIQGNQFIPADQQFDKVLTGAVQSVWISDANFGIYYSARDYYAGYSTMQVFNSSAQFGKDGEGNYKVERQHNLLGGYKFVASAMIDLEPSFLIKIPESSVAQLDLTVKGVYDKKYWAGLAYRTGSALSLLAGMNYDRYYFGYAFDYNFGSIRKTTYGSHEFMLSMRFGDTAQRFKWLNSY